MTLVVLADADFDDFTYERDAFADAGIEFAVAASPAADDIEHAAREADGLLVMWSRVDAALLDRLPALRVVGRYGTGLDRVDVEEATWRKIGVVNSGHYATEEVSAHAVSMVLALLRRLLPLDRAVRSGAWISEGSAWGIRRFSDVHVGVVGLGQIGHRVATLLHALGLSVLGFDPAPTDGGIPRARTVEDLLAASDVVTLHVPLTNDTHRLLSADRLALLPRGAFVVNTSRGETIDEGALVDALRRGALGGAALDVFETEPMPDDHPLYELPNVLLSPHVAYYSTQSLNEARARTVEAMVDVLSGVAPAELVNPEALSLTARR